MVFLEHGIIVSEAMKGLILGFFLIVGLLVGGYFVYQTTEPEGDVTLDDNPIYSDDGIEPSAEGDGQFIQLEPGSAPPNEALDPSRTKDSVSAVDDVTTSGVVVSMTDTGFVPNEVRIELGTTVTFVNDGQGLHWPASDVHPTHEVLPAFDSKRAVPTGGRYSHTFTEAGSWDCHDHLNAKFTCRIVVE